MNDTVTEASKGKGLVFALLALIVVSLLTAEALGRFVAPRISRIEGQVERELAAVRALPESSEQVPTVVLYGNSLLDTAVPDAARIEALLGPAWRVRRLAVQATNYLDWNFGLRNLLHSGQSQQVVALMLNAQQLISDNIRGTYSAYRLFSGPDSWRAGVAAGLNATETSGLVVGHYSAYYGLRFELRKFAFQKLVPHADTLAEALLRSVPRPAPSSLTEFERIAVPRLANLRALCDRRGVKCILLVPPEIRPSVTRMRLVELAEAAGLVARRFDAGAVWPKSHFQADEFHFSPLGGEAYENSLVERLRQTR